MSTLHAHIDTHSTDCDGPLDRSYIMEARDDEDGYDFKARLLSSLVSWSYDNHVAFDSGDDDGDEWDSITVSYQHDEGYFSGDARTCRNPECDPTKASQRDHYAEAMGY